MLLFFIFERDESAQKITVFSIDTKKICEYVFFMLSIAIKNLLCFLLYVEGERKKFRSTKFLCDNKKFRLANNIDAYAITLFFLFFFTSKHRVVAVELYQKKERRQKLWKVTRSFFYSERCILYCETFPVFKFLFLPFFYSNGNEYCWGKKKYQIYVLYNFIPSLSHSLTRFS